MVSNVPDYRFPIFRNCGFPAQEYSTTLDEAIATDIAINIIAIQYLKFFLKKLSKNVATCLTLTGLKNYELFAKDAKDNFALVYESDNKVLQILNNIMVTKFKDGLLYDEVVGKKKRLFEALGVPIPTVVTSDYEDENEEINDPESVEDLESISRRTI